VASVLSRYITRRLLARAAILLTGLAALMMILDFLANGDQVIAGSESVPLPILRYTVLRLPEIVAQLLPITAMLAGLLTFADLTRHSELTAMAAAGVSKARLAAAVLPVALLIAATQFLVEDQAVPVAVARLRAWGIGDYAPAAGAAWLRYGDDILRIQALDPAAGRLDGVTVFRRDPEGHLVARLSAPSATYEDGGWTLHDVTRSEVRPGVVEHQDRLRMADDLDPKLLASVLADPRETPLSELLRAIRAKGLGTQPSYRYKLWLQERLAAPVTTIAMILIIVALARPLSGRAAQGWLIALGVAVGFVCWTFDGLVLTIGDLGLLPPVLAAWTPLVVFATLALWVGLSDQRRRREPGHERPRRDERPDRVARTTATAMPAAIDSSRGK
jgi:lipopolysaccharide export system permease protein